MTLVKPLPGVVEEVDQAPGNRFSPGSSGQKEADRQPIEARQRVEKQEEQEDMRCGFCGRTAAEAGPLITGEEAAICSGCVKKLMLLDGKTH